MRLSITLMLRLVVPIGSPPDQFTLDTEPFLSLSSPLSLVARFWNRSQPVMVRRRVLGVISTNSSRPSFIKARICAVLSPTRAPSSLGDSSFSCDKPLSFPANGRKRIECGAGPWFDGGTQALTHKCALICVHASWQAD